MPAAVREALMNVAEDSGKLPREEAVEFIAGMELSGRLIEECWS